MDTQWQEFCDTLLTTGNKLLAAAPDEETRVEGLAYLARVAAYNIERNLLAQVRMTNGVMLGGGGVGGSNPDFRYSSAPIQPEKHYRLKGRMNDAHRVALSLYTSKPDGGFEVSDFKVFHAGSDELGADGSFEVAVSPEGSPGDGLKSKPTTNVLLLRDIVLVKNGKRPDFAFEAEESMPEGIEFSAPRLLQAFNRINNLAGPTEQYLEWSNHFASLPNTLEPIREDFDAKIQGDPDSLYFTGYFHLASGQSLLVEVPEMECDYWSFMLANHWQEPLVQSHLNHCTATRDADGVTRIVIAAHDPGCANWLPTEGRTRGVIWHRRLSANNAATPKCTLRGQPEGE
jgi:hypothetical protein